MYMTMTEKIIVVIMTIAVVLMSLFTFGIIDRSTVAHNYYDTIKPKINSDFKEILPNVFITKELDEKQEKILTSVIQGKLDSALLYDNDYYIIITDDKLSTGAAYAAGGNTVGVTDGMFKTISINFGYINYALSHELGHAVDNTCGFSATEEFLALYNRETDKEYYFNRHPAEYFANGYDLFVNGRLEDEELLDYFTKITETEVSDGYI